LLLVFFSWRRFAKPRTPYQNSPVKNLGNDREGHPSVVISWVNPYDSLLQISIQTSHDSLRNYRTLVSLTDPNAS
jgi:hypothetical protein